MPVVHHQDVPAEAFSGGATYQTIVGDAEGSTPFRVGIQSCPPGYTTAVHYHPYLESVTVLEGCGEAWMEGIVGYEPMQPGMTFVFPPNLRHQFRAVSALRIMGGHASPHRIVIVDDTRQSGAAPSLSVSPSRNRLCKNARDRIGARILFFSSVSKLNAPGRLRAELALVEQLILSTSFILTFFYSLFRKDDSE